MPAGLGHSIGASRSQGWGRDGWMGFLDPVQQHVVRKRLAPVASFRMRSLRFAIVRTGPGRAEVTYSVFTLQGLSGLSLAGRRRA